MRVKVTPKTRSASLETPSTTPRMLKYAEAEEEEDDDEDDEDDVAASRARPARNARSHDRTARASSISPFPFPFPGKNFAMCSRSRTSRSFVASIAAFKVKRTASGVLAMSGAVAYDACESNPKTRATSPRARIKLVSVSRFASGPPYAALYTFSRVTPLSTQRMHAPSVRWSSGTRTRVAFFFPSSPAAALLKSFDTKLGGKPLSSLFSMSIDPSAFGSRRLRWNAMPCRTTSNEALSRMVLFVSSRWMPPRSKSRRSVNATRAASGERRSLFFFFVWVGTTGSRPFVAFDARALNPFDCLRVSSTARRCLSCVSLSARYRPRSALSACTYACSFT